MSPRALKALALTVMLLSVSVALYGAWGVVGRIGGALSGFFADQPTPAPPSASPPPTTLAPGVLARQMLPALLGQIYAALNDGNPQAVGAYIDDRIEADPAALDRLCPPYGYRAHYIDGLLERPDSRGPAFVLRAHVLLRSGDERATAVAFLLWRGRFVLVDITPASDDWLRYDSQAASEAKDVVRRFIYAAKAGRTDVLKTLSSPGLEIGAFGSEKWRARLDEIDNGRTALHMGSTGLVQRDGLKIRVDTIPWMPLLSGRKFLVEKHGTDYRVVAAFIEEGAILWGPPGVTDPALREYTLQRFGLLKEVASEPSPSPSAAAERTEGPLAPGISSPAPPEVDKVVLCSVSSRAEEFQRYLRVAPDDLRGLSWEEQEEELRETAERRGYSEVTSWTRPVTGAQAGQPGAALELCIGFLK